MRKLIYTDDLMDYLNNEINAMTGVGIMVDAPCLWELINNAIEIAPAINAPQWRPFEFREPDADEKADHPEWEYVVENAPPEDTEILVSNGRYVWVDEFCCDGLYCYLDSGTGFDGCAWMPFPDPHKVSEEDK